MAASTLKERVIFFMAPSVASFSLFRQGCFARGSNARFALGRRERRTYSLSSADVRCHNQLRIGARGNDHRYIPTDGNTDTTPLIRNDAPAGMTGC